MLAATFRRIAASADGPLRPSAAVPLDRAAVRVERDRLARLAAALADVGSPVSARGVALAQALVTDPASPLYRSLAPRADALHGKLTQTLFELERGV